MNEAAQRLLKQGFAEYRKRPLKIWAKQMSRKFKVKTLEGVMEGKAHDFLVIGIKGEKYPVDYGIFIDTYYKESFPTKKKLMK